jgi:hypothetical protein
MSVSAWVKDYLKQDAFINSDNVTHITYLVIISVIVFLPFFISYNSPQERHLYIGGFEIPGLCLTNHLFKIQCPGCGLTRSFVLLTHGRIGESLATHRLGIVLYLYFLLLLAYRVYCIFNQGRELPEGIRKSYFYVSLGIIVLLLLNWFIGLFCGGNGF